MTELVKITFGLVDPTLDRDELSEFTEELLLELGHLDAVEKAELTENPIKNSKEKSLSTILGSLTTVVKLSHIQAVFAWFKERLKDKNNIEIEIEITKDGDKELKKIIKVKTTSQDLPVTKEAVRELLKENA